MYVRLLCRWLCVWGPQQRQMTSEVRSFAFVMFPQNIWSAGPHYRATYIPTTVICTYLNVRKIQSYTGRWKQPRLASPGWCEKRGFHVHSSSTSTLVSELWQETNGSSVAFWLEYLFSGQPHSSACVYYTRGVMIWGSVRCDYWTHAMVRVWLSVCNRMVFIEN